MGNRIDVNDILYPGNDRWSDNGVYQLVFQEDNNFVLYKKHDDGGMEAIWASNTWLEEVGSNHQVLLQADGNFVLYDGNGQALWASDTGGSLDSPFIVVQDDGNVCMYDNNNPDQCYWSTNTYQG